MFTMGRAFQLFVNCEMDAHVDMRRALLDVAERSWLYACLLYTSDAADE